MVAIAAAVAAEIQRHMELAAVVVDDDDAVTRRLVVFVVVGAADAAELSLSFAAVSSLVFVDTAADIDWAAFAAVLAFQIAVVVVAVVDTFVETAVDNSSTAVVAEGRFRLQNDSFSSNP